MNVSFKNNEDAVSGIVKLEIMKEDYAERVEKSLRSFRQKANMPGFRKGMVPLGLVKKMYGKNILADEINKLISENLTKYIRENDMHILGEPLPNTTEQKLINFDTEENFEFLFDVALTPQFEIELSKDDKVPFYHVVIPDDMVNNQVESYRTNFGTYEEAETVEENDVVKGTIAELENGTPKEGGIVVEGALLMPAYLKDEEEKAKFMNATKNTVVVFNPLKAYEGAEAEIASLLKIKEEQVAETTNDFSFEIKVISRHAPAVMDQAFFDKVLGENVVSSVEELRGKIKEMLAGQFDPQSDFKFLTDIRGLLVEKAGEMKFAEGILKRWLFTTSQNSSMEKIEEEFPQFLTDLRYQLIKDYLVRKTGIKIEENNVVEYAKRVARAQFAQYGMLSVPEDVVGNYANDMMKNKETLQNIYERVIEDKLAAWLKEQVELDVKEVSVDEFNKMFEE